VGEEVHKSAQYRVLKIYGKDLQPSMYVEKLAVCCEECEQSAFVLKNTFLEVK